MEAVVTDAVEVSPVPDAAAPHVEPIEAATKSPDAVEETAPETAQPVAPPNYPAVNPELGFRGVYRSGDQFWAQLQASDAIIPCGLHVSAEEAAAAFDAAARAAGVSDQRLLNLPPPATASAPVAAPSPSPPAAAVPKAPKAAPKPKPKPKPKAAPKPKAVKAMRKVFPLLHRGMIVSIARSLTSPSLQTPPGMSLPVKRPRSPSTEAEEFKGVTWSEECGAFVSELTLHLGQYDTPQAAALAYDAKARSLGFAEADMNFPAATGPEAEEAAAAGDGPPAGGQSGNSPLPLAG